MTRRHRYSKNQIIVDQNGRRWQIAGVGLEAHLVRRLDWRADDCEPRETAWAINECERATELEGAA